MRLDSSACCPLRVSSFAPTRVHNALLQQLEAHTCGKPRAPSIFSPIQVIWKSSYRLYKPSCHVDSSHGFNGRI
uniref:Uncharacterized protein n=1 Tax=Kalanchoe fedtschenkoi TaxID=63787 RepID=A0A7N0VHT4_KALFE